MLRFLIAVGSLLIMISLITLGTYPEYVAPYLTFIPDHIMETLINNAKTLAMLVVVPYLLIWVYRSGYDWAHQ